MTELVSLIVCTVGRSESLARLLASLQRQIDRKFELIVVDQSGSDEVEACLYAHARGLHFRHLRSARGLSHARNVGLGCAQGSLVGFPDDDCWYDEQVLERVRRLFGHIGCDVLTGRTIDAGGADSVSTHRRESGKIDRHNVFVSGNSNTLFARTAVAVEVGGFDESLGVGASTPFRSGEETDFLLRCLKKGYRLYYDRDFTVHHDQTVGPAASPVARARGYSRGYGRLLRVHDYGLGYLLVRIGRTTLRGALCLAAGDTDGARQRYGWADGALRGFFASPERPQPTH